MRSLGITVAAGGPLLSDDTGREPPGGRAGACVVRPGQTATLLHLLHPVPRITGGGERVRKREGGGMMRVPVHKGIGNHSAPAPILAWTTPGA